MAAYAFTPAFLLAILYIFPPIGGIFAFLGLLYGLYIFYLGVPILTSITKDKAMTFTIVSAIAVLVVYFVISFILGLIADAVLSLDIMDSHYSSQFSRSNFHHVGFATKIPTGYFDNAAVVETGHIRGYCRLNASLVDATKHRV